MIVDQQYTSPVRWKKSMKSMADAIINQMEGDSVGFISKENLLTET